MRRGRFFAGLVTAGAMVLAGCSHEHPLGVSHYAVFNVAPPHGATVSVCHAYGCRMQTRFTFAQADLAELDKLMKKTRKADTAAEERRAVAYAIGWIERRVGDVIGTKTDRPGMDFTASGDPTQQDCVDEATNTTSYLTVLQTHGLIKHHAVGSPFSKENLLRGVSGWTHWTAILVENGSGQRWAVDSWIYGNGENPAIVEADKWYMGTLEELPKALH